MVSVVSPHLLAVDDTWDDGPLAGSWIADRLGPFGPTGGNAVPLGYEAYAIVPIPPEDPPWANRGSVPTLQALVAVLGPLTGGQPVHFGMWDGWGWWYPTGSDPRAGMAVGVYWSEEGDPPSREELERARAEGRERFAANEVECPDAEPLALPYRDYYLWTGPLRSATAFHQYLPRARRGRGRAREADAHAHPPRPRRPGRRRRQGPPPLRRPQRHSDPARCRQRYFAWIDAETGNPAGRDDA
jgi:hypothetical protein